MQAGVAPCGLGCRDTLRLEAGMNLYGQDMDERVTATRVGLAWTVAMTGEAQAGATSSARAPSSPTRRRGS